MKQFQVIEGQAKHQRISSYSSICTTTRIDYTPWILVLVLLIATYIVAAGLNVL